MRVRNGRGSFNNIGNYSPSLGICGVTGLGRKETYVSQDADLKHYGQQLQSGHTDPDNYLRKMAHRLKL